MAGTAKTPLAQKLGIQADASVLVLGAPPSFDLQALAPGIPAPSARGKQRFRVALLFVARRAALASTFERTARHMTPEGGIWMAWPKKASGIASDITDNVLRDVLLPTGWVDNKVCALDDTYSGLRFVRRRELR